MKLCESGGALAVDKGVLVSKMEESIAAHNHPSLKTAQDPDGGPFPAYPSGKSWDETSGKTGRQWRGNPCLSPARQTSPHFNHTGLMC